MKSCVDVFADLRDRGWKSAELYAVGLCTLEELLSLSVGNELVSFTK